MITKLKDTFVDLPTAIVLAAICILGGLCVHSNRESAQKTGEAIALGVVAVLGTLGARGVQRRERIVRESLRPKAPDGDSQIPVTTEPFELGGKK